MYLSSRGEETRCLNCEWFDYLCRNVAKQQNIIEMYQILTMYNRRTTIGLMTGGFFEMERKEVSDSCVFNSYIDGRRKMNRSEKILRCFQANIGVEARCLKQST